jgi:chromosome segregation ATPase
MKKSEFQANRIAEIELCLADATNSKEKLEKRIAELQAEIATVDPLRSTVLLLEEQLSQMTEAIAELENKAGSLEKEFKLLIEEPDR